MRVKSILIARVALLAAVPAIAQFRPPPATLTVHPLKGGVYWVKGGITNTGFVVGTSGVIVIDPQMMVGDAKTQIAEIAKITPKLIDQIIVSHSDPDHIGGLPGYPAGTPIIAQENTRTDMAAGIAAALASPNGRPLYRALKGYLPTRTIAGTETLTLDGVRFVLIHDQPAHTASDLMIYLPGQKIAFVGDLLSNAGYPSVHDFKNGTTLGWISTIKVALALDTDTYIIGHGDPMTKAQARAQLLLAETRRAAVKALVEQGKTRAEVLAALPEPNPPAPGTLAATFLSFTEIVFNELTQGYPRAPEALDAFVQPK